MEKVTKINKDEHNSSNETNLNFKKGDLLAKDIELQSSKSCSNQKLLSIKEMVATALLLALGFILHGIIPPVFFGIKPDLLLACLFISVIICPKQKNIFLAGIVAGIISALTTSFPAGQIPSVLDKISSAYLVYSLGHLVFKSNYTQINLFIIGLVGTFLSGLIFLGSAYIIAGLPASFLSLVATVVIPTSVVNGFMVQIFYSAYKVSLGKKNIQ